MKFENRIDVYCLLPRDEDPASDEEQAVYLDIPYPDVETELNRWLPLKKLSLAILHYLVLIALAIAVVVVVTIFWFAILFTGSYPSGLFDLLVGVLRWSTWGFGYGFLLTTDRYPPFRLSQQPLRGTVVTLFGEPGRKILH